MKKYLWLARDFIVGSGWTEWRIKGVVEIISETVNAWQIRYAILFWTTTVWVRKDDRNVFEEIVTKDQHEKIA